MVELFDETDAEEMARLRQFLHHPVWRELVVAKLEKTKERAMQLLLDPSDARKQTDPDDYLRAVWSVADMMVKVGSSELADLESNISNAERYRLPGRDSR